MAHHVRKKRSHDRSTFSTGKRDVAGTAHTTPATLHAMRKIPSQADSTTTPSNTYYVTPEAELDTSDAALPPLQKVASHCIRHCSRFSLQEAQLECTKARQQDPKADCHQACCLQECCLQETPNTAVKQLGEGPSRGSRENSEGIMLKTLKPYRSYSLRLSRNSSRAKEQDSSFTNGPSRTHVTCSNSHYNSGELISNTDLTQKNRLHVISVPEIPEGCSKQAKCATCRSLETGASSEEEEEQQQQMERSSQSGCSDARSEFEEVIITTAC